MQSAIKNQKNNPNPSPIGNKFGLYCFGAGKQRRFLPAGICGEGGSGLRKAGSTFRGLSADRNVQPARLSQKQTGHSTDGTVYPAA